MRVVTVSYQAITAGVQTLKQGNYVAKCELSLQPDNPLIDVSLRGAKSTYKYVASLRVTTLQYAPLMNRFTKTSNYRHR